MDNLIRVPAPIVQQYNERGEIVDVKQPEHRGTPWFWALQQIRLEKTKGASLPIIGPSREKLSPLDVYGDPE